MEIIDNNSLVLKKLGKLFLFIGFIEIFLYVFLIGKFLIMIPGLFTVLSASYFLDLKKIKWGYFIGIWALIKYNPFIVLFLLGDFFRVNQGLKFDFYSTSIFMLIMLIALSSFILGIVIIVKTAKQINLSKKI